MKLFCKKCGNTSKFRVTATELEVEGSIPFDSITLPDTVQMERMACSSTS